MDTLEVSQAWSVFKGLPPRTKTFCGYENKAERRSMAYGMKLLNKSHEKLVEVNASGARISKLSVGMGRVLQ